MHDEKIINATQSAPKHNKFSETVFGFLDNIMKTKPNMTTISAEAYISFTYNKTSDWLEGKSHYEQKQLFDEARKDTGRVRAQFKERHEAILKQRIKDIQKKMKLKEACEKKRVKQLEE